ncbi:MAG TPA: TraR/DksA C4-type zinc finger protein [Thermoanaerobaculia bacterium]|nr:TraR/DksA C4-type zinc finger protein [Thermoanaerobaculia bacterium]
MSHLTAQQLDLFHEILLSRKAQIASLLDQTAADSRPVDLDLPIGRLTRIDAIQMQGMAQLNRRQLEIRREQVELALTGLDSGTYGSCRMCKGPIGLPRLEALPESPFCLACQERNEQG